LEELGIEEKIILKWMLEKQVVNWVRIGYNGRLL
jgi:hypothetical protein